MRPLETVCSTSSAQNRLLRIPSSWVLNISKDRDPPPRLSQFLVQPSQQVLSCFDRISSFKYEIFLPCYYALLESPELLSSLCLSVIRLELLLISHLGADSCRLDPSSLSLSLQRRCSSPLTISITHLCNNHTPQFSSVQRLYSAPTSSPGCYDASHSGLSGSIK